MQEADQDIVAVENNPQPNPAAAPTNRGRTINKYIVLSYYIITNLERSNAPYSIELHRRVANRFPEIAMKTIQNILDQKRSIMRNNRLIPTELLQIKRQAEIELGGIP